MFCFASLCFNSSLTIISMGKRELVALLYLSSWCLVVVVRLFPEMPQVCLQFVIWYFWLYSLTIFVAFVLIEK